jgi:hypothetical protein
MRFKFLICFSICLCLNGCLTASPAAQADKTLMDFYQNLADGNYQQAASLYGGSYETLQAMNPTIAPDNHPLLWQTGCTINGLRCLPVRRVVDSEPISADKFIFTVEFRNPDGQVFIKGPCCGAAEEEMPSVSQFKVHVIQSDGRFLVQDLPPYIP